MGPSPLIVQQYKGRTLESGVQLQLGCALDEQFYVDRVDGELSFVITLEVDTLAVRRKCRRNAFGSLGAVFAQDHLPLHVADQQDDVRLRLATARSDKHRAVGVGGKRRILACRRDQDLGAAVERNLPK